MKLRRGEFNLYVSNLERAADFYVDALDFEVTESPAEGGYRKVSNGEIDLTFFLARRPGPADPPGTGPCMTADLHVDDDEIEEARRRLEAAGAKVSPLKRWPGGRHLLFSDLDGISWELLSS